MNDSIDWAQSDTQFLCDFDVFVCDCLTNGISAHIVLTAVVIEPYTYDL